MQDQLDLTKYGYKLPFNLEIRDFLIDLGYTFIGAYRPEGSQYDKEYNIFPFTDIQASQIDESQWYICPILSKEVLDMDNHFEFVQFMINLELNIYGLLSKCLKKIE